MKLVTTQLNSMHAGATMIPELGFWHSAPESVYMAECPNHAACQGDRHRLHACQTAAYTAPSLNGSIQVGCALALHLSYYDPSCLEASVPLYAVEGPGMIPPVAYK